MMVQIMVRAGRSGQADEISARFKSFLLVGLVVGLPCAPANAADEMASAPASTSKPSDTTAAATKSQKPVVTDWRTGVALYGIDPVAYFSQGKALRGSPEHEYVADGVTWRFRNEGNRAAFSAHPEIYSPCFGGYDPAALARGVTTPGNPLLWVLIDSRLYLFHDAPARAAFLADPQGVLASAATQWPQLRAGAAF
jgi:hypothetical protein